MSEHPLHRTGSTVRWRLARRGIPAALLSFLAVVGCTTPGAAPIPSGTSQRDGTGISGASGIRMSSAELQATLFGYADTYIALIGQSADNLMAMQRDAQWRVNAIRAKLDGAEAVVEIVTGPNPTVALLDLAVMVTIQRQVWIDYWEPIRFKEAAYNYMDSLERLENEIWRIADRALTPEQVAELHVLAGDIRQQYIHQVFVTNLRASQITASLDESAGTVRASSGLVNLFGLAPAMEEVTRTRVLAERMFYFSQKLPTLIGWRADLQIATAMSTPEAMQALGNIDEVVTNSSRFADLAESLPATIDEQRAALLRESEEVVSNEIGRLALLLSNERTALFEGIAAERESILDALESGQGDARATLAELRTTIEAAERLGGSVNEVMTRINELAAPDPDAAPKEPGRPFDILEYQRTIESATVTIRELNSTVERAQQILDSPQWSAREQSLFDLLGDVERRGRSLISVLCVGLDGSLLSAPGGAADVWRVGRERPAW
ncbi:MAG: hypothetical protein KDA22_13530, partial [Phycisphaerales bacterium]|nr:hypothetical protein [Phycisphaerales bacterium]